MQNLKVGVESSRLKINVFVSNFVPVDINVAFCGEASDFYVWPRSKTFQTL